MNQTIMQQTTCSRWGIFEVGIDGPKDGNPFIEQKVTGIFKGYALLEPDARGFSRFPTFFVSPASLEKIGPGFEHHEAFPKRVNTEFIQVLNRSVTSVGDTCCN